MGSSNHRHNKRLRESIHRCLDSAMKFLAEGNRDSARRMLEFASSDLRHVPWDGGPAWSVVFDRCRQVKAGLDAPCACWFCCCEPSQKQEIRELTALKETDL